MKNKGWVLKHYSDAISDAHPLLVTYEWNEWLSVLLPHREYESLAKVFEVSVSPCIGIWMFHEKIRKCVVFEPINVMSLSRICEVEMLNETTTKSITLRLSI